MADSCTNLIQRVRDVGGVPDEDAFFTNDFILSLMNDELSSHVFPEILKIHSNYNLMFVEYPLYNQSLGMNIYPSGKIPLPDRCWGQTVTNIMYKTQQPNGVIRPVQLLDLTELDLYPFENIEATSSTLQGVIVDNNWIKLIPTQQNNYGLVMVWFTLNASPIINDPSLPIYLNNVTFNTDQNNITTTTFTAVSVGSTPSGVCPVSSSALFDIFKPLTGTTLNINILCTRTATNTFTTTALTPNQAQDVINSQYGSYANGGVAAYINPAVTLTLANQNYYSPIINELDKYFVYRVAYRCFSSQMSLEEKAAIEQELKGIWHDTIATISKRIERKPRVVKNNRGLQRNIMGYRTVWRSN